ncbi:hypothetical protein AJ79_10048 [Helicocarpus griseus UAMH5409]|uniref:Uncharacterized protein n=1 Tax=Helicocarpus griseus UAMH5409 TaxID=1447875 RepID=A0A2B7WFU6_9EURO|nr:hypothetical protein AJ79_10048 [Helicocarpus griseus UAMH5409]
MITLNDLIHNTLQEDKMIRVVVDVLTSVLRSGEYLASAYSLLDNVVKNQDERFRLFAVDIYRRHTYLVLDINNRKYDFETAHKDQTPIPVYALRQTQENEGMGRFKIPKRRQTGRRATF